jgi:hypothetical protein
MNTFLSEHHEGMKKVEKILYFLSAAVIGVLSFGSLNTTSGLMATFSFMFLFFAYAFWYIHSQFESDNIQYENICSTSDEKDAIERLTDFFDRESRKAARMIIFLILGSVLMLGAALADQFVQQGLVPVFPSMVTLGLLAICFVVLLGQWLRAYFASGKSLVDFKDNSLSVS